MSIVLVSSLVHRKETKKLNQGQDIFRCSLRTEPLFQVEHIKVTISLTKRIVLFTLVLECLSFFLEPTIKFGSFKTHIL